MKRAVGREKMGQFSSITIGAAFVGAAFFASGTPVARAFPTGAPLWGITGTGTMPNTQTVMEKQVEGGLGYETVNPAGGGSVDFAPVGTLTYGLRRGEIGVGILREDFQTPVPGLNFKNTYETIHAKYRVYERPTNRTTVAVGAHYLNFDSIQGHVTSLYAVAAHPLTKVGSRVAVNGNVGVLYQNIRGDNPGNETRPFVSLEAVKNHYSLSADYASKSGQAVKIASLALRYQKDRYGVQIGYGQFRGGDDKVFAGVVYRFGGKSTR